MMLTPPGTRGNLPARPPPGPTRNGTESTRIAARLRTRLREPALPLRQQRRSIRCRVHGTPRPPSPRPFSLPAPSSLRRRPEGRVVAQAPERLGARPAAARLAPERPVAERPAPERPVAERPAPL